MLREEKEKKKRKGAQGEGEEDGGTALVRTSRLGEKVGGTEAGGRASGDGWRGGRGVRRSDAIASPADYTPKSALPSRPMRVAVSSSTNAADPSSVRHPDQSQRETRLRPGLWRSAGLAPQLLLAC